MNRQQTGIRTFGFLALTLLFTACPVAKAADDTSLSRAERRELWRANMRVIETTRDAPVPEKIVEPPLNVPPAEKTAHWLSVYRKQLAELNVAKAKDFDVHVERAKAHLEKDELRESLIESYRAMPNAPDKEKFLSSDWIRDLEGKALAQAEGHRKAFRWNKAHAVYYDLTIVFEDNKEYDHRRRECLNIARLDAIYDNDKDDDGNDVSRWAEMLEGIDPRNAMDALERIGRFYVEEVDFRDVTAGGIEHLLLLGESKVMHKTFVDGLGDDALREEFSIRLQRRLTSVRENTSARFRARAAKEYFRRILTINDETVRLPEELIVYEFMAGALEPLDDFTSVIWPIEFREFDKHTRGDFVGVGISITGGWTRPVTVISPLEDTPAFRAGVLPEDVITHVNGDAIKGLTLNKVVKLITGPIGTDVTIRIHREAEQRDFDLTLTRALVKIQSVKGYERDADDPSRWRYIIDSENRIGYVRVNSFQENTVDQLKSAIEDMETQGVRGLVLDLRLNPGGLMRSAIDMAQLFLERDDDVVSTRGLIEPLWKNPKPPHGGPYRDLPLVVLVNEGSASASEIVSGALQDHDRAILVGDNTFGKFSVQKLMQLRGGEAHLKLTTARYYLPSGRMLHHDEGKKEWGIAPDFMHKPVPKEIMKLRQMWRKRDVLGRAPEPVEKPDDEKETDAAEPETDEDAVAAGDDEDADGDEVADATGDDEIEPLNLEDDPNELPDVDVQFETALLLMRLHLLGENQLQVATAQRGDAMGDEVRNP